MKTVAISFLLFFCLNNIYAQTNKSVMFADPDTAHISMGTHSVHQITTNLTVEAWIKPSRDNTYEGIANNIYWTAGHTSGYGLFMGGFSTYYYVQFIVVTSNWNGDYHTYGKIDSLNGWYHIAGTYDGAYMRLYVNGVLADSLAVTGSIDYTYFNAFRVGKYQDDDENIFYQGLIDDVRLWNVVRTQSEIADNRFTELVGNETGLVGYWKLNEGSGTTTQDATSNDKDGTLSGGVGWANGLGTRLYATTTGAGSNDGSSWGNAMTGLQAALTAATPGGEIWVAKGTYVPSYDYGLGGGARYYHFRMIEGTKIYGGFAGSESAISERTDYGIGGVNETILSGDVGTSEVSTDNCYHVFYHPSGLGLTSLAVLDGFTIKGGNANGTGNDVYGGGMYNEDASSLTINYCSFISNNGASGGGMYNIQASPVIANCTFVSNTASDIGSGMMNDEDSFPKLTNCLFHSNSAVNFGGGISNFNAGLELTNCTITSNSSAHGGGIANESSNTTLFNCIVWGNEASSTGDEFWIYSEGSMHLYNSCFADDTSDVFNNGGVFSPDESSCIVTDPQFAGSSLNPAHPYSLLGISPCVDAGHLDEEVGPYNNEAYDIRGAGYPRKLNKDNGDAGTIDMGVYEYKLSVDALPVELTSLTAEATSANVTLAWQTATEVNNYGFEVERRRVSSEQSAASSWSKVGFVDGAGTSNAPKEYSFTDSRLSSGRYAYRLRQVDIDGAYKYSGSVEIDVAIPKIFALSQNFPNPFNPETVISYELPVMSSVKLAVYDILGREVAVLVNEEKPEGAYTIQWNASKISSGMYFYRLDSGKNSLVKKLVLMK